MRRWTQRGTNLFLMGAALVAAPLVTVATPAIAHAECAPAEGMPGEPAECDETTEATEQWSIDPNLTPEQNIQNYLNTYPPQLNEPLVQNSIADEMPVEVAPTVALPGVGVNLWPDLTPFVAGAAAGAVAPNLPAPTLPPPDLAAVGHALQHIPPPQMPPPPPRLIPPICGPQLTPFFTPCI